MRRRREFRSRLWSLCFENLEDRRVMAGEFTDLGNLGITNSLRSSASWGDFDNDGDLDVLVTGFAANDDFARVFRNNNGTFVDHQANLFKAGNGAAAWGDYDKDGDLDIVLTGRDRSTGNSISKIYRNDNGSFIDIAAPLVGVRYSSVDWGDYDNDGDLDLLIAGRISGSTNATRLYRNDGNNSFTNIPTSLLMSVSVRLTGVTTTTMVTSIFFFQGPALVADRRIFFAMMQEALPISPQDLPSSITRRRTGVITTMTGISISLFLVSRDRDNQSASSIETTVLRVFRHRGRTTESVL